MRRLYQEKNILFELIGRYKSNFFKKQEMLIIRPINKGKDISSAELT